MNVSKQFRFILSLLLFVYIFSSCGGFHSVRKLEKIKPPEMPTELENSLVVRKISKPEEIKKSEALKPTVITKIKKLIRKKRDQKKALSVFDMPDAKERAKFYASTPAFRVGEKITMSLTWFAIKAGEITMQVLPFVSIGDRKAYHFKGTAKSSALMDWIHSVDDWIESYVDTETFYPFKMALHGVETDRLREERILFDYRNKKIHFWMKRVHVRKGIKEKKRIDNLTPGILDLFTVGFFLRTQKLQIGKTYYASVYNKGKRIKIKGKVLRSEILETDIGDFNALVIRPEARFEGILKTSGDSLIWVTNDERHFILKIETKIKIGYLNINIIKLEDPEYDYPSRIKG